MPTATFMKATCLCLHVHEVATAFAKACEPCVSRSRVGRCHRGEESPRSSAFVIAKDILGQPNPVDHRDCGLRSRILGDLLIGLLNQDQPIFHPCLKYSNFNTLSSRPLFKVIQVAFFLFWRGSVLEYSRSFEKR